VRIVLDANILVSALISGEGAPGQVLTRLRRERITLVTSRFQIDELRDILAREKLKPYIRPEEADDLVFHLEAVAMVVAELPDVNLSPDPGDNPMLATALAGQADMIVSGDKTDMLALRRIEGIPIVTAHDALERLRGRTAG
jgi:putative PIN family toxin of toxin-antitoxin system